MEKVKFICQVAHSSEFYFRKENEEIADKTLLRAQLEQIMRSELRSSDPYGWFKAYFYRGLWDHVNHVPRGDGCGAGSLFCYLDSSGDMYPCILLKEKMGTVKEAALADVWMSRAADEVREKVKGCDRNCWLICTATPSIKERPQRALPWILKNMIRAHTAHALL
jgi:MoaA/NifB/PqqE/SkfB family radical SAM enzyme